MDVVLEAIEIVIDELKDAYNEVIEAEIEIADRDNSEKALHHLRQAKAKLKPLLKVGKK